MRPGRLSPPAAVALGTAIAGAAAAWHYHRLGLTLAHFDARAHLVVARRIFDSLTPGWQQVGAVWLPLPHLLNTLPVQIDFLYRSGAAAVAISIAAMAFAAGSLAWLIQRATGSIAGGVVAAALLMANPNVLYLQSTPMSEPLLFGTTCAAIAWIARRLEMDPAHAAVPGDAARTRRTGVIAGWWVVAACLSRYEAWPIVAAALAIACAVLVLRGVSLASSLRVVRGLAWWPAWTIAAFLVNSKVTVGSWFVSSGFFVPDNPARHHPWLAWTQVWDGFIAVCGPVLPWMAAAAGIVVIGAAIRRRASAPLAMVLALAASAALPWAAYVQGHQVRVRYDVPLAAAAAAWLGAGVALLPRRVRAIAGALIVTMAIWQAPPLDARAAVIIESQRDVADRAGREAVTAYLRAHWDGQPIMMSMGSLAHYMHDLSSDGFAVRDFLHEGNGEIWKAAVAHPQPFAEWIAVEEHARGGDALYWQGRLDRRFFEGYARVAAGGNVALYRRRR